MVKNRFFFFKVQEVRVIAAPLGRPAPAPEKGLKVVSLGSGDHEMKACTHISRNVKKNPSHRPNKSEIIPCFLEEPTKSDDLVEQILCKTHCARAKDKETSKPSNSGAI